MTHHNKEPIKALAHHIVQSADLLAQGSAGLVPSNVFFNKLKLAQCVCLGPYHKAFEWILNNITITQRDEWDLTIPTLTYEHLNTRLADHLCWLSYMTASSGLKNGSAMSSPSDRMAIETFDKWGKTNQNQKDSLVVLNWYFNASGSVKECPICFNYKAHPFTAYPHLVARGFTVTYDSTKDTKPDFRYRPAGTPAARKAALIPIIKDQVDTAVAARFAAMDTAIEQQV